MFVAVVPYKDMDRPDQTLVFDTSDLTLEFVSIDELIAFNDEYGISVKGIGTILQDMASLDSVYYQFTDGRFQHKVCKYGHCEIILDGAEVNITVDEYILSVNEVTVDLYEQLGVPYEGRHDFCPQYAFEYKDYYILRCSFATQKRWSWITLILNKEKQFIGLWDYKLKHFVGADWVRSFAIQCDTLMEI